MTYKKPKFNILKILNEGTANPIVNRMSLQFAEILDSGFLKLQVKRSDNIKKLLFECMEKLLKAEKVKNSYLLVENEAIGNISSGEGIEFQKNAIILDDPTTSLKRLFEDFLINCVIAIRKVIKISEIILNVKIDGPGKLREYLEKEFSNDKKILKIINEDSKWIMELYSFRMAVEHDELGMMPFKVNISDKKKVLIKIPRIPTKKATVREYLKVTLDNCFTFCEDLVFLLFRQVCSPDAKIILVPESQRKNHRDFKYVLIYKI